MADFIKHDPHYASDVLFKGAADGVRVDLDARLRLPAEPEAACSLGFTWAEIIAALNDHIVAKVPDLRGRKWLMKVYPRANGVRIDFFTEEGFFLSLKR